jgi:hypothetical protein
MGLGVNPRLPNTTWRATLIQELMLIVTEKKTFLFARAYGSTSAHN